MNELFKTYWPELLSLFLGVISLGIAICSLIISKKAWHKSREIYGIERTTLRQVRGRADDIVVEKRIKEISDKLANGGYTILNITSRQADGDFEIIFGKVKK